MEHGNPVLTLLSVETEKKRDNTVGKTTTVTRDALAKHNQQKKQHSIVELSCEHV